LRRAGYLREIEFAIQDDQRQNMMASKATHGPFIRELPSIMPLSTGEPMSEHRRLDRELGANIYAYATLAMQARLKFQLSVSRFVLINFDLFIGNPNGAVGSVQARAGTDGRQGLETAF
jgi:hypothetical protein